MKRALNLPSAARPNMAVNTDAPDTFVLLASRCGATPVSLYR
jgi:hypothetical protein